MVNEHQIDRPRGVLSKADRRYLVGENDMESAQSERNTRARIRERIINKSRHINTILKA